MRLRISYILYKILIFVWITFPFFTFGQCELSVTVDIEDFTTTSIPVYIENAQNNDLSNPSQGICGLYVEFEHTHVGDLIFELVSPAGQSILIVGTAVNSGNTSSTNWNVFFTACSSPASPDPGFSPLWSNNQNWGILGNYSGTYYPNSGCLEDFNSGPVNGIWQLNLIDANLFDSGILLGFSIVFCDPSGLDCVDCFEVQNESMILTDTITCSEPTVSLTLESPFNFDSTIWTGPNNFISNDINPVVQFPGMYAVTAYFNGICTAYFEVEIEEDIYAPEIIATDGYIECKAPEIFLNLSVIQPDKVAVYQWIGPNGFNSDEQEPIISAGGNYFVTVTNSNGCSSTADLNVEENFQHPIIMIDDMELLCNSDSVMLSVEIDIPIVFSNWTGPNGFTSNLAEPKIIDTGEYVLLVEAFNGCVSTDTLNVGQNQQLPEFSILQFGGLNCASDSVLLIAKEVDDDAYFEWNDGNNILSTNDSLFVFDPGAVFFKIVGINDCVDSLAIQIEVDTMNPIVQIDSIGYLKCAQQTMELHSNGSSTGEQFMYQWSSSNGMIISDSSSDSVEIGKEGMYYLTIRDTSNECISTDSIEIIERINDMHDLTAALSPPACSEADNGQIFLSEVLGGTPPFVYALDEGPFISDQLFTGLSAGEYIISIKDQDGCLLASSVVLEALDLFLVDLGPDLEVLFGESITLNVTTTLADGAIDSILWEPGNLTSCSICDEIELIISSDTSITVQVIDTNHCVNSADIIIGVLNSMDYYIPNIFSPNQDGVNDYFYVQTNGAIKSIEQMIIFDKRAIPYFEAYNIPANNELDGWDGRWESKKAAAGVYIYFIKLKLHTGEIIMESGDITLIR